MKKLVAYFSATGTTENVAKTIAKLLVDSDLSSPSARTFKSTVTAE